MSVFEDTNGDWFGISVQWGGGGGRRGIPLLFFELFLV